MARQLDTIYFGYLIYINAYLKWYAVFNRVESTAERYIGEKTKRGYIEQRYVTVYPLELLDEVIKILAYVILDSDFKHYVMMEFGRSPIKHREQCINEHREAGEAVVNSKHDVKVLRWELEAAEAALANNERWLKEATDKLEKCSNK